MFSRSYATSYDLEQERLSSPAGAVHSPFGQHLARAARSIPEELRAIAPSSPFTVFDQPLLEEDEEAADANGVVGVESAADPTAGDHLLEPALNSQADLPVPLSPMQTQEQGSAILFDIPAAPHEPEVALQATQQDKPIARTGLIGRLLFPPSTTSSGKSRARRVSLPASHVASTSQAQGSKRASLPGLAASVAEESALLSSRTATSEGVLPVLPLAAELASLKARNATLAAALSDAEKNLAALSEERARRRTDAEGWEAEAQRLASELAAATSSSSAATVSSSASTELSDATDRIRALERALASESSKRRRGKELQTKLRCELVNRRWKEKWEVELLEREERKQEITIADFEAEVAGLRWERDMERADKEELQDLVAARDARISTLAGARQLLLSSYQTAEATITSLRSELSSVRVEYDASLVGATARIAELEDLAAEAEELRAEVARLENGSKKGEESDRKALERERAKKEKAEGEVKELKKQLKTTQAALESAEKAAAAAAAAAAAQKAASAAHVETASRALQRSSSTVKAGRVYAEDTQEQEEEPDVASSPEPAVKKTKRKAPVAPSPSRRRAPPPPSDIEDEVSENERDEARSGRDEDSTAEAEESDGDEVTVPSPKLKKKPVEARTKARKVASALSTDDEKSEAANTGKTARAATTPAANALKKRKGAVLGDKSANAASEAHEGGGVPLKIRKGKKKRALVDSDDDADAHLAKKKKKKSKHEDDTEPTKKKKKIQLFGGPKQKFPWDLENANVNSLVPVDLSPIKLDQPKKKGSALAGLALGGVNAARRSIFA